MMASNLQSGGPLPKGAFGRPERSDREIALRTRANRVHGVFPTRKGIADTAGHTWFTDVEHDCMHVLEADAGVVRYRPRPGSVRVTVDGEAGEVRPHFLVEGGGKRTTMLDIDDGSDRGEPGHRARAERAVRDALAEQGVGYVVRPRSWIRLQPRFDNCVDLVRFISVKPAPEDEHRLLATVAGRGGRVRLDTLEVAFGGVRAARPLIYAMALRGSLLLDMSRRFSAETDVTLGKAVAP